MHKNTVGDMTCNTFNCSFYREKICLGTGLCVHNVNLFRTTLYLHVNFTRYPRTGDRNMAEQGALLIMIPMKMGDTPLSSAYIHT